jgi:RNA polymerase sigma-70 factor (ECF subfamily)
MDDLRGSTAWLAQAGWVRSLARALVHDLAAAEDLAQDTLLVALQQQPRDERTWRSWVRTVLRNLVREDRRGAARREERVRSSVRAEALPSALDDAARLASHRHVVAAVEALEEPFRGVVLLRYFDGLPPREIAARLGVPVKTVHSRLQRAHERLRGKLEAEYGGDRRQTLRALALLVVDPRGASRGRRPLVALGVLAAVALLALRLSWPSPPPRPVELSSAPASASERAPGTLAEPDGAQERRAVCHPGPSVSGRVLAPDGAPPGAAAEPTEAPRAAFSCAPVPSGTAIVVAREQRRRGNWSAEVAPREPSTPRSAGAVLALPGRVRARGRDL